MKLPRRSLLAAALVAPVAARAQVQAARHPMPERGRRAWAQQIPQLRIGILGGENEADRQARYGGYGRLLEETFGIPVRLFQASDYSGVVQAFAGRHIEMASMSPAAYAAAWMESNGNVEPFLVTQERDGSTSYVAVMYVRADSGITSLEQMRGRSMAWADPNSASGFLIPRAALRQAGINPEHARHPHHLALRPDPERAARGAQGHAAGLQGRHDGLPPGAADRASGHPSRGGARHDHRLGADDACRLRAVRADASRGSPTAPPA